MTQTINISISGISFNIEQVAYSMLKNYLARVHKAYLGPDSDEITRDIEARVAELILSWQKELTTPVTVECIKSIISQLGEPDPAEPTTAEDAETKQQSTYTVETEQNETIPRRLYRNMDGAKLGGVLNGIASRFDVDVVMVRLIFIFFLLLGIFGGKITHFFPANMLPSLFIVYIAMWIVVPKAITPRQKLEMTGRKVTVSSIEDSIKQEISRKQAPTDRSEKRASRDARNARVFSEGVGAIGRVIRAFVSVIASIMVVVFSVMVTALLLAAFNVLPIIIEGKDYISQLSVDPYILHSSLKLMCWGLIIPLIIFIVAGIQFIFRFKINRLFYIISFILWIMAWVAIPLIISSNIDLVQLVNDINIITITNYPSF